MTDGTKWPWKKLTGFKDAPADTSETVLRDLARTAMVIDSNIDSYEIVEEAE
jgi:hypothetical protein